VGLDVTGAFVARGGLEAVIVLQALATGRETASAKLGSSRIRFANDAWDNRALRRWHPGRKREVSPYEAEVDGRAYKSMTRKIGSPERTRVTNTGMSIVAGPFGSFSIMATSTITHHGRPER
jgi:hypothetical protein